MSMYRNVIRASIICPGLELTFQSIALRVFLIGWTPTTCLKKSNP